MSESKPKGKTFKGIVLKTGAKSSELRGAEFPGGYAEIKGARKNYVIFLTDEQIAGLREGQKVEVRATSINYGGSQISVNGVLEIQEIPS